ARHAHDAVVGVRLLEHALGARDEALRDALVPRAGDDDHADPRRVDAALLGLSRSAHCAASSFMRATAARISASPMMCPMRSRLVSGYWWLLGPTPTMRGTCSATSMPKPRSCATLSVLFVSRRSRPTPSSARIAAAAA